MTTATARTTPCIERMNLYFGFVMSQLCRSVQYAYRSKNLLRLNIYNDSVQFQRKTRFTFSKIRTTLSFHVVVLQRTAKKCTKDSKHTYGPAILLIELLFGDALVAVPVVVC